jgi:uncharacterized iron-regulated membrane protein
MLEAAGKFGIAGCLALLAGGSRTLVGAIWIARKRNDTNAMAERRKGADKAVGAVAWCFIAFAVLMLLIALTLLLLSLVA